MHPQELTAQVHLAERNEGSTRFAGEGWCHQKGYKNVGWIISNECRTFYPVWTIHCTSLWDGLLSQHQWCKVHSNPKPNPVWRVTHPSNFHQLRMHWSSTQNKPIIRLHSENVLLSQSLMYQAQIAMGGPWSIGHCLFTGQTRNQLHGFSWSMPIVDVKLLVLQAQLQGIASEKEWIWHALMYAAAQLTAQTELHTQIWNLLNDESVSED